MYQESEQQPAPPLPTGTMSLCIGCRTFPLEDFFPEQKYGSYTHSEDAPWKTWSPDTTLADTSKAFWLGTIAEVRLRAQNCDLCAFALDSDCAFWEVVNTSSESDGLGLQETMATVRSLPDECRVCIFRWPLTRPKFFVRDEGYVNSRDRQGRVIVAASTHAACNIPETILRERFGAINDAGWRQDQEIKVQRWDKDTHCGGSHVPMQWIETKLNVCLTKHKSCAVPYKSFGPDSMMSLATIRLVDIERRIVIERTLRGAEYAVLSYVWGRTTNSDHWMLTSKSKHDTKQARFKVYELPSTLPATIEDAMTVSKALCFDYLWVDSACILQDSEEDKKAQIDIMSAIYANAALCIIDAAGNSANHGLAGVSVRRPHSIATMSSKTTLRHDSSAVRDVCNRSPYLQRGWCYQERLLARRCLIFYEREVCFACAGGTEQEVSSGLGGEPSQFDKSANGGWPSLKTGRDLERFSPRWREANASDDWRPRPGMYYDVLAIFRQAILAYGAKQLTYETDLLNAFSCVASIMKNATDSPVRFGTPERGMHRMLLWEPLEGARWDPRMQVDLPSVEDHGYGGKATAARTDFIPSWAWMSWNGPVTLPLPYDSTMPGTQARIFDPQKIAGLELERFHLASQGLTIRKSSLLMATKLAWLNLEVDPNASGMVGSGLFIHSGSGTTSFPDPTRWSHAYDNDGKEVPEREQTYSDRKCTIEDSALRAKQPAFQAAFIQIGALQQTATSSKDSYRNRFGNEDEVYLLLVDVESFPFEQLENKPDLSNAMHTFMENSEARRPYESTTTIYIDPLSEYIQRPIPSDGMKRTNKHVVIGAATLYAEDRVFVACRKGTGHIPESAWKAAQPKDVLVVLT